MKQDNLDLLSNIQQVDPPEGLYDEIVRRIQHRKAQTVPWYQVGVAAFLVLGLLISEIIIATQPSNMVQATSEAEQLLPITNNSLYYE